MPEVTLPEATLIALKRISKDFQKKWQARINYSGLFDLDESYKYPREYSKYPKELCLFSISKNLNGMHGLLVTGMMPYKHFYILRDKVVDNKHVDVVEPNIPKMPLAIRPVFKFSEIKEHCTIVEELGSGYLLITFGAYPSKINNSIKSKYKNPEIWKRLRTSETGNKYRLMSFKDISDDIAYIKKEITEYPEVTFDEFDGRFVIKDDEIYEVEPVYFLVDVKNDFAISKDIMFYLPTLVNARKLSSYKETLPYEFLNTFFVPDLMQNVSRENSLIKDLIDNIFLLIANSCLESSVKEELQSLINEYNNDLDNKKHETESLCLVLDIPRTPEEKLTTKLQSLISKITSFPYFEYSKIIERLLKSNISIETDNELYKDIMLIFNYILPTLPEEISNTYKEVIRNILENAKSLIINLYKEPTKENINIELIIRKDLQPLLEKLSKDVATNYICINMQEIISGLFKTSSDLYQAHLFDLINSTVREIEILIADNKLEKFKNKLTEILNSSDISSENYLIETYINLLKLKNEIEERLNNNESIERKKIRRKFI